MITEQFIRYQNLHDCYLSGQISEYQWQQHLEDHGFANWLADQSKPTVKHDGLICLVLFVAIAAVVSHALMGFVQ